MILGIYGSGGLGREVLMTARQINACKKKWTDFVFINDFAEGESVHGVCVKTFDDIKNLYSSDVLEIVIAVGEPSLREKLWNKITEAGYSSPVLIHPSVIVPETTVISSGTIIGQNAFISCDAKIKENVYIQPMAVVGHDAVVEKNSVISLFVALAGNVHIGQTTYIAMGTVVREKTNVGNNAIVSAGAVVLKDLPDNMISSGNPARPMLKNETNHVFKQGK